MPDTHLQFRDILEFHITDFDYQNTFQLIKLLYAYEAQYLQINHFIQKRKKIDFEEKKFNERFSECFFTSKDQLMLSLICIKELTQMEHTLARINFCNENGILEWT